MKESIKSNKREEWVDIAKAFAIIAVVVGHIDYNYPDIRLFPIPTIIAWMWHVPVFFMIGGFFLREEKLIQPFSFIKGKIKNLYLPILYLYVPVTLLHNILIDCGFYSLTTSYGGKSVTYWGYADYAVRLIETVLCAGREPLLGAMWFAYVLFMALCFISILCYVIKRFIPNDACKRKCVLCIILLTSALVSNILTNVFDYTIPRFSNLPTAAWLIYIGMLVMKEYKLSFNNKFFLLLCIIIFYCCAIFHGNVSLNQNNYDDIVSLTLSSFSALYIIVYISKKCKGIVAKIMSVIGRNSFYIMGLHFFIFKLCSLMLNCMGFSKDISALSASCSNLLQYVIYTMAGVFGPLIIIYVWRKAIGLITKGYNTT